MFQPLKERASSREQASEEAAIPPFSSAEFGDFFEPGTPKESSEGGFGFPEDFTPEVIPYSETSPRNVTRYVSPAETYTSVKDIPGKSRDYRYSKEAKEYREPRGGDHNRKEGTRRDKEDPYKKDEKYTKDDSYHKEKAYRKSDSFRKDESYKSKENPQYESGDPYHRKHSSKYRKEEGFRKDDDRPYRSRSEYSRDRSSYRHDDSSSYRRDRPDYRGYRSKPPVQAAYDDYSPEDDRSTYREGDRGSAEYSSEYDEPDYRESEEQPPPPSPPSNPRREEKEPRSKIIPTSMRPGPPYYASAPGEPRTHTTSFGVRHEHPPPPTPQTFYAPSTSQRKHDNMREFHHRKGQPSPTKAARTDWTEFRPSPPDPIQSTKSKSRGDYPHTEYSNPLPDKVVTTTQKPLLRGQNCVKLKKTNSPDHSNGRYMKKMTTCYVCLDEKTGMNYEECSYESDLKTRPYLKTSGTEEGKRTHLSHRNKRDLSNVFASLTAKPTHVADRAKRNKDYYDSSKESKEKENDKSEDEVSEEDDTNKEEPSDEEEPSLEDNCYRKKKGEMSCIVCQTPNKKGTYEECSYGSDPKKNKYAHSVEKVYGSARLPDFDSRSGKKDEYSSGSKEDDYESSSDSTSKDYPPGDYEASNESDGKKSSKSQFGGGTFGGFGDFGDSFEGFGDISGEGFDFDSIPEPAENEGQFSTKNEAFNFKPEDIEAMTKNIGDFGQKNRSNCKKVMKNKMTCYQCITSVGTKNEECMYVAAAEPKSKHLSFSQVQEYRFDPLNSTNTNSKSVDYPTEDLSKRKFKKYHPDLEDIKFLSKQGKLPLDMSMWPRSKRKTKTSNILTEKDSLPSANNVNTKVIDHATAASETNSRQVNPPERSGEEDEEGGDDEENDGEREEVDEEDSEEDEPGEQTPVEEEYQAVPTDPPEIDLKEAEKGEFDADTQPAWDPKLGISLPRYMLEKSEHEAVFDEVLASG